MFNKQEPKKINFEKFTSNYIIGHNDMVNTVDICKQRNLLASGSDDRTVKLWNLQSNSLIRTYKNYGRVFVVVFSNQGNLLAFGGDGDYSISVINISDLKRDDIIIREFMGHAGIIKNLIVPNDSKYLISRSLDNTVRIWDINSKKESFQLNSKENRIARIWDINQEVDSEEEDSEEIRFSYVAINNDNSLLASITQQDGRVSIWDLKNQKQLCSQQLHTEGSGIAFSNDQIMLVSSGCGDCMIKLWNLVKVNQKKLLLIRKFKIATKQTWTVQFSGCSGFIICISCLDKEIKVIDSQTGNQVTTFKPKEKLKKYQFAYVAMSKNMDIIAYGDSNKISVWRQQ